MIHVGDITKLNGAELPVVDVVTGGSPCQDLSVAGKRAGLAGERSGLFMEQVRIVKEMREHDRSTGRTGYLTRPRYMLWENVPGAFSSNKGEDFRAVLEEIAKVEQEDAHIPRPEGSWPYAGCVMGDGWSIAWRLHDAQFWGVPQRRKRIALVADFGGQSAPEILFERKGMRRDPEESGEEGEGTSSDVKRSVAATITSTYGTKWNGAGDNQQAVCYGISSYESNAMKSANPHSGIYEAETARTLDNNGGSPACNQGGMVVLEGNGSRPSHKGDGYAESETMYTLNGTEHHAVAYRKTSHAKSADDGQGWAETEVNDTLNAFDSGERQGIERDVVVQTYQDTTGTLSPGAHAGSYNGQDAYNDMLIASVYGVSSFASYKEGATSLRAQGGDNGGGSENIAIQNSIVRRLTPLECERLQGFPDGWTDIGEWTDSKGKMRKCSDSARYKALGNSIAIPFWFYILRRMAAQYERPATLGSLFDGIGGFPLCWERCNGKGTAIWASEIEEFPIAVTKKRFGDS